ncbi:hypothetical protein ACWEQL_30775 [Kitasatospora sp. NPDC004240]
MSMQELGPTAADVQSLRSELDELLRARQFAAQRVRRLTEAIHTGRPTVRGNGLGPDPAHRHGHAPSAPPPDQELLRQLAQAQALREGLGVRCLELSDRLLALEDRLLSERRFSGHPGAEADHRTAATPVAGPPPHSPVGPAAGGTTARPTPPAEPTPPAAPARKRLTGARFGTVYQDEPEVTLPSAGAQPLRGARFGGLRTSPPEPQHGDVPTDPHPSGAPRTDVLLPDPPVPAPAVQTPRLRSPGELSALVDRVDGLHRSGAAHESAAIVAQAAATLAPADVARLVELLRSGGPAGSAAYLARSVAHCAPEQAAGTLAELRRSGQVDEAAELFHALWSAPTAALPALLAALDQAGQAADGQTLLWERASAPSAELADLALRLWESGRAADVRSLLRQAAGRPTREVAAVALTLERSLVPGLVGELVRRRQAADVVAFAAEVYGDAELYGALLAAIAGQDESRSRSALAALRAAGLPIEPPPHARPRGRR